MCRRPPADSWRTVERQGGIWKLQKTFEKTARTTSVESGGRLCAPNSASINRRASVAWCLLPGRVRLIPIGQLWYSRTCRTMARWPEWWAYTLSLVDLCSGLVAAALATLLIATAPEEFTMPECTDTVEAAGLSGPHRWGLILPNSSRVSLLTYKAVVAARYPELVTTVIARCKLRTPHSTARAYIWTIALLVDPPRPVAPCQSDNQYGQSQPMGIENGKIILCRWIC